MVAVGGHVGVKWGQLGVKLGLGVKWERLRVTWGSSGVEVIWGSKIWSLLGENRVT